MSGSEETMLLAGEYVLGVLEADEMRAVAGRALGDPALAAEIREWERQLAPLALLLPPVAPPGSLWPRLLRSIDAMTVRPGEAGAARQLRLWRGATAASLALAAAIAVVALLPRGPAPVAPAAAVVAALAPLAGPAPAFLVRSLPDGKLQVAALRDVAVPGGHDLELWALPHGATRPVSLGVLPATGRIIEASALTGVGGKLLVSLEPKGGSPTGLPTGAVLYGGVISRL